MVGVTGFEPATSWSQTRRSTKLSYTPHAGRDLTPSSARRMRNLDDSGGKARLVAARRVPFAAVERRCWRKYDLASVHYRRKGRMSVCVRDRAASSTCHV